MFRKVIFFFSYLCDFDSTIEPLHVPEGAITRSRKRRFNTFTPHLQKIANSREETKNFEAKFMYNVSSMSQEEIGVNMT